LRSDVHIIEKYLHEIKHWFTISNLTLGRQVEVDLLAYDPRNYDLYHIESALGPSNLPLRAKSTMNITGDSNKNGLDYFSRERFDSEVVKSFLGRLSDRQKEHRRILVARNIDARQSESVKQEAKTMGIEIWLMRNIIQSLAGMDIKDSSDDVIRTIELCREELKRY
jgi:hypothetical protein